MEMTFLTLLLLGIPEQVGIVVLATSLAKTSLKFKEIIFMGTILAVSAYLIRQIPITFGVHTVVLIGINFFYLNYIKKFV